MRPFFWLGAGLAAIPLLRAGEPVHFSSGAAPTALIELYTSEGCSSCPPAERWLGELREDPGLWREFVPVAFHVDYWNRLGWPDRYSTRAFTAREYAYASAWQSASVYTPCVVLNGAEWHVSATRPRGGPESGTLSVVYDGAKLVATFTPVPALAKKEFEVHAALLGGGIVSKVTAGENRGETLRHEFIALALAQGAPGREISLSAPAQPTAPRHALAVWVTRRGELTPLQATGGWLD